MEAARFNTPAVEKETCVENDPYLAILCALYGMKRVRLESPGVGWMLVLSVVVTFSGFFRTIWKMSCGEHAPILARFYSKDL